MRYVLAIAALAISGVLLLLGIGQRTFLAGPAEIVYPISTEGDAAYAVIDASEFSKVDGQANVIMRGGAAFTALANTRDAEAWLAPFDHARITVDAKAKSVETAKVAGTAPTNDLLAVDDDGNAVPIDPRGSDLWLESRSGEEGVSRMAIIPGAKQSVIIAGTGKEPIPKGASLVWVQDRATPLAGPFLAAGALFAAIGGVLYLLAFDRDKRALGPRRGRRGPLLGVRNVFGRTKTRGAQKSSAEKKQGSLSNAAALTGAESLPEAEATTDGMAPGLEAEDVIAAEVVLEEGETSVSDSAAEAAEEIVVEDAELEDAELEDAVAKETEPVDDTVEAVVVPDESSDSTDDDAGEGSASKKGDDHAE